MRYLLTTKETSYYGNKLNPERPLKTAHGIKGTRQKVIVTHNRSEIDQNQLVLARLDMTAYEDSTHFGPYTPQYKKLKNGELVSLAWRMKHMKNNIMTDCQVTTIVLHIR